MQRNGNPLRENFNDRRRLPADPTGARETNLRIQNRIRKNNRNKFKQRVGRKEKRDRPMLIALAKEKYFLPNDVLKNIPTWALDAIFEQDGTLVSLYWLPTIDQFNSVDKDLSKENSKFRLKIPCYTATLMVNALVSRFFVGGYKILPILGAAPTRWIYYTLLILDEMFQGPIYNNHRIRDILIPSIIVLNERSRSLAMESHYSLQVYNKAVSIIRERPNDVARIGERGQVADIHVELIRRLRAEPAGRVIEISDFGGQLAREVMESIKYKRMVERLKESFYVHLSKQRATRDRFAFTLVLLRIAFTTQRIMHNIAFPTREEMPLLHQILTADISTGLEERTLLQAFALDNANLTSIMATISPCTLVRSAAARLLIGDRFDPDEEGLARIPQPQFSFAFKAELFTISPSSTAYLSSITQVEKRHMMQKLSNTNRIINLSIGLYIADPRPQHFQNNQQVHRRLSDVPVFNQILAASRQRADVLAEPANAEGPARLNQADRRREMAIRGRNQADVQAYWRGAPLGRGHRRGLPNYANRYLGHRQRPMDLDQYAGRGRGAPQPIRGGPVQPQRQPLQDRQMDQERLPDNPIPPRNQGQDLPPIEPIPVQEPEPIMEDQRDSSESSERNRDRLQNTMDIEHEDGIQEDFLSFDDEEEIPPDLNENLHVLREEEIQAIVQVKASIAEYKENCNAAELHFAKNWHDRAPVYLKNLANSIAELELSCQNFEGFLLSFEEFENDYRIRLADMDQAIQALNALTEEVNIARQQRQPPIEQIHPQENEMEMDSTPPAQTRELPNLQRVISAEDRIDPNYYTYDDTKPVILELLKGLAMDNENVFCDVRNAGIDTKEVDSETLQQITIGEYAANSFAKEEIDRMTLALRQRYVSPTEPLGDFDPVLKFYLRCREDIMKSPIANFDGFVENMYGAAGSNILQLDFFVRVLKKLRNRDDDAFSVIKHRGEVDNFYTQRRDKGFEYSAERFVLKGEALLITNNPVGLNLNACRMFGALFFDQIATKDVNPIAQAMSTMVSLKKLSLANSRFFELTGKFLICIHQAVSGLLCFFPIHSNNKVMFYLLYNIGCILEIIATKKFTLAIHFPILIVLIDRLAKYFEQVTSNHYLYSMPIGPIFEALYEFTSKDYTDALLFECLQISKIKLKPSHLGRIRNIQMVLGAEKTTYYTGQIHRYSQRTDDVLDEIHRGIAVEHRKELMLASEFDFILLQFTTEFCAGRFSLFEEKGKNIAFISIASTIDIPGGFANMFPDNLNKLSGRKLKFAADGKASLLN